MLVLIILSVLVGIAIGVIVFLVGYLQGLKRWRVASEELGFITAMAETLMEASVAAHAKLLPLTEAPLTMPADTFNAIDAAGFELGFATGYVYEACHQRGITLTGEGE